ncbi:MAG: peptidoglycan DD-metalloendopeptidase family protein [Candidatus Paceibacterota bacterium]
MKQFQDYKMQYKISLSAFWLVGFLAFSVLLLSTPNLSAQTAEELQNRILEKDQDISRLEAEIAKYQNELNSLSKQKSSLAGSIKELDITRRKLATDILVTEKKIEKTSLMIGTLSSDIGNKEKSIRNNQESIKLDIRRTHELETQSILEIILAGDDFTVVWNDIDNIASVRQRLRTQIVRLQETKLGLEDTRAITVATKDEFDGLKIQLAAQQKIVVQNKNEKNKLLTQTKNNEANYQKLLKDRIAKREALEKELQDYEAQLRFILDPSTLPSAGVLSWPLDSIFVTSPYGPRWGGYHRGVDFRAAVGTPVKAAADGTVKGAGDTDICCPGASFGKWILIEHNNGLSSTSAHLSLISVMEGQKVTRGQIIGYSGNTGSSTGPHLHFSVYVSSGVKVDSFESKSYPGIILVQPISALKAYLEPMYYLPPYKN